jgi:hypothetical protein
MALHSEKKITNCKNKMTIRNFSDKQIKITIESTSAAPLTKDDFHVTIDHGHWQIELWCDKKLVNELKGD